MLLYLYGIVRSDAPAPPPELRGIERGELKLIRLGAVAGIVGEVPAEHYSGGALDKRLTELDWVGERGVSHDAVLTWYADRGPVIPLQPFSLHGSPEAVLVRLSEAEEMFSGLLKKLAGHREWGVKLWRIEKDVIEHLAELSPAVRAVTEEMEAATPGRRFLLAKKKASLHGDELRVASITVARHVYDSLVELAAAGLRLAIPTAQNRERALVLHAAFLVADERFEPFQQRVSQLAVRFGKIGFECEFTGPWPPYHFVQP